MIKPSTIHRLASQPWRTRMDAPETTYGVPAVRHVLCRSVAVGRRVEHLHEHPSDCATVHAGVEGLMGRLQTRLFLFTAAVGGGLTGFAYVWKGLDTGASLGVGALLSLLYLRLLSKGVDSMTGGGGGPSAPSILVPVLIFGIYKRWRVP